MKVLLIKPPHRGFMHEIGRHYPIGLTYLASSLLSEGHQVEIFDSLAFTEDNHLVPEDHYTEVDRLKLAHHPRWRSLIHWGATFERIERQISLTAPDVVGISCMFSPFYQTAFEVARLAKRLVPKAPVLMGGQHPTIAPRHVLLSCPEVDVAMLGEAESVIKAVLGSLENGRDLGSQEGVAVRCGEGLCSCDEPVAGRVHETPQTSWLVDLDVLGRPVTGLLDFDRYDRTATLITSRGCPFKCTFCTVHAIVGDKFRSRSAVSVVDEIEHYLKAHDIRRFSIEDDNFTFSMPRVIEICNEVIDRGLEVELNLPNGMTVVRLTEEVAELMATAGFRELFLGLESTDLQRLRLIAKRFTSPDQVSEGYKWFTSRGVVTSASLIVGLPGQGTREIARDVATLLLRGIKFWSNPFYPIPGSPDYRTCMSQGLITEETDFALFDQFNFATRTSELTAEELYWIYTMTQAASHWPGFVLDGCRNPGPSATFDPTALEETCRGLVASTRRLRELARGDALECPAEPCGVVRVGDDLYLATAARSCFGAVHLLPDWRRHADINRYTGDLIAMALSIVTGTEIDADPVAEPPVAAGPDEVFFRIRPGAESKVFREFTEELRERVGSSSREPMVAAGAVDSAAASLAGGVDGQI